MSDMQSHLRTGLTTLCRAWAVTRADGTTFGFTDHDCDLTFEGVVFKANTGLNARTLTQSTGLSIDNTEAVGALSDASVTEADIEAGRFDGAEVRAWQVNWADPAMRRLLFRAHFGEIRRAAGAFEVEMRGLTEALNRPLGRVYQKPCTAVLGDGACGFDLSTPGYRTERAVDEVSQARRFVWPDLPGFEIDWFARGRLDVLSGAGTGLWGLIKFDRRDDGVRIIELWEPIRAEVKSGDLVRLTAGCDRRFDTCRFKFNNLMNFQGFPDVPGEDWQMTVPSASRANTGGSLR